MAAPTLSRVAFLSLITLLIVVAGIMIKQYFPHVARTTPASSPTPSTVPTREMGTRFEYNPKKELGTAGLTSFNNDEPPFSLQLPDGWYYNEDRTNWERLVVFSPNQVKKDFQYRTVISVNITPSTRTLKQEVDTARIEIGKQAVHNVFLVDKAVKLKNYSAHILEYNLVREQDAKLLQEIAGEDGQLVHHVDVITVKDGYLIDISASSFEWAWKDTVADVEKAMNSFRFTE